MRLSRVAMLLGVVLGVGCSGGDGGKAEPECVAGEKRCGEAGTEVCMADGSGWEAGEACQIGATCLDGACLCGAGLVPTDEGCVAPASEACAEGFAARDGVPGCYPATAQCAEGQALNATACIPVGVTQCAAGMAVRSDGEGCEAVLSSCDTPVEGATWGWALCGTGVSACAGEGKYAAIPLEGAASILYVDASAAAGGDGSLNAPYQSLQSALAASQSGSVVLLAKGTYLGGVKLTQGVTVAGKCADEVILEGGADATLPGWLEAQAFGVWVDTSEPVALSGITFRSLAGEGAATSSGVLAGAGSEVRIADVRLEANVGACVALVEVAQATIERMECLEVQALDSSPMGPIGLGLYVEGNQGPVSVTGSRFMKVQGYDVYAKEATATIAGNWFEGRGVWSGQEPMGVRLQDCLEGVEVTGNRFKDKMQHALFAQNSEVLFSGNKVDGLISDYEDINGPAVKLVSCTAEVKDNLFSGNQFGGILFEKTSGTIMGNLIEGSVPSDPGLKGGDGVVLVGCDGEPVVVQNNTIAGNTRNGVLVSGSDAEVVNNVVVDTLPSPLAGSEAAAGINVVAKSSVKTQGNRVLRSTSGGIRYDEAFGSISGNEVTGVEEHPAAGCAVGIRVLGSFLSAVQENRVDAVLGVGIRVFEGKVNFVRGNLVEGAAGTSRSLGVGIALSNMNGALVGNAVLGAEDAGMVLEALGGAVTDNTVEQCGEASGLGGVVVMNSTNPPVQLERNTVNGCFGHGLAALNLYGQFRNNVVYGTQAAGNGAGVGIWVQGEGEFSLSRNLVEESVGAGLLLVDAPTVTIGSTLVRGVSEGTVDAEGSSQKIDAGVLLLSGSVVTFVNSRIEEAAGDGLFIGNSSEATLANSEFVGNGGAGIEVAGTLTEEGTRFSGNTLGERILDSVKALVADLMGLPEVCG